MKSIIFLIFIVGIFTTSLASADIMSINAGGTSSNDILKISWEDYVFRDSVIVPEIPEPIIKGGIWDGDAGIAVACYKIKENSCIFEGFKNECPEGYFKNKTSCKAELIKIKIPKIINDTDEIINDTDEIINNTRDLTKSNMLVFLLFGVLFIVLLSKSLNNNYKKIKK